MAQIKFSRLNNNYALESIIETYVEIANEKLKELLNGDGEQDSKKKIVRELTIGKVSLGSNPPYVELTQISKATEFPHGLVPNQKERGSAKVYSVGIDPGESGEGKFSTSISTLDGNSLSVSDILKTLPFMNQKQEGNQNENQQRRSPSPLSDDATTISMLSSTDVQDHDVSDELPGIHEAICRHMLQLLPPNISDLFGEEGLWTEFTVAYAGDLELELSAKVVVDTEISGQSCPGLIQLPITCRVHSLRIQAAVEFLIQDGYLTVYVIPEANWSSPASVDLDVLFGNHPRCLDDRQLTSMVRNIISDLLFEHVLWPNSIKVPLAGVSRTLRKTLTHWVAGNTQAR